MPSGTGTTACCLPAVQLLTYSGGLAIGHASSQQTRKLIVGITVALHLLLLSTFKYLDFLVGSANHLLHFLGTDRELPFMEIILPVGISFFTFHGISYLVDVYRGDVAVCRRLVDILLYLSFFPQLVAGPIVRARVLPAAARPSPIAERVPLAAPVLLILGGPVQEGGDRQLSRDRPGRSGVLRPAALWRAPTCCWRRTATRCRSTATSRAYTDMAIGMAALLGYRFPRNFDQPYRAQSLREFWRRWHISLSTWLRDYLYMPLGGSRGGRWLTYAQPDDHHAARRLWHGAAWKFVAWGGLHGAGLVVERWWQPWSPRAVWAASSRCCACSTSSAWAGSCSAPTVSPPGGLSVHA